MPISLKMKRKGECDHAYLTGFTDLGGGGERGGGSVLILRSLNEHKISCF